MLNQKIVPDSIQLLERGYLFNRDLLFPFGPRSTNTNFVFGPLISIFVGIALSLYEHPMAPLTAILFTHVAGFLLLQRISFLKEQPRFLFIFLFLYWLSPWRASEVFLWNPSFLFPVMVLYLYGLDLSTRGETLAGNFIVVLSISLAFQIHNSFVFLCILTLWLGMRRIFRLHVGGLLIGAMIGACLLIPSVKVVLDHPEILQMNRGSKGLFANLLSGGEAIKGALYWFRYPSFYFGATTFQLPAVPLARQGHWEIAWTLLKWSGAAASLVYVAFANVKFFKHARGILLWEIAAGGFLSLVFVSALSPVPFNFWHLYLVYPLSLIPIAWVASRSNLKPIVFVGVGSYFLVYAVITSNHSYKHERGTSQADSYQRHIHSNEQDIRSRLARFTLRLD